MSLVRISPVLFFSFFKKFFFIQSLHKNAEMTKMDVFGPTPALAAAMSLVLISPVKIFSFFL